MQYLMFGAFPIVFQQTRGWHEGVGGTYRAALWRSAALIGSVQVFLSCMRRLWD